MEYDFKDYIEKYSQFLKLLERKKIMKLLITGACGHIGSCIIDNVHKIKKIKQY